MICALSVSVGQIIKQGEHTLFIRTKRRFLQKETLLPSEKNLLVSEGNIASIREKCRLRQRETCLYQRETLLASEGNNLSIGIPSLFLLFLSNYLRGEKYFSAWRKILFSAETRIFLRRDNSIPSVAKSGENGWKSNALPFIAVFARQKNPQLQGNDSPTSRRPRNNSANPIMVDCRFMKQRC